MAKNYGDYVYRCNIITIINYLTEDDVEKLLYLNAVNPNDVTSPMQLIKILEQRGVVGSNNLNKFAQQLRTIRKPLLADILKSDSDDLPFVKKREIKIIKTGCIFYLNIHKVETIKEVEIAVNCENPHYSDYGFYKFFKSEAKKELSVKVEKFFHLGVVKFRLWFEDSNKNMFFECYDVEFEELFDYEFNYDQLIMALPEPISNKMFCDFTEASNSIDWRKALPIKQPEFQNEDIEFCFLDYIDTYFSNKNETYNYHVFTSNKLIMVLSDPFEIDLKNIIVSFFKDILNNENYVCAVLPCYRLSFLASILKCGDKNINDDAGRLIVFLSSLCLVMFFRIASSMEQMKNECANCQKDFLLFLNVNKSVIKNKKLIMVGIVVLPVERSQLEEEFYFQFPHDFRLHKIFFLCKDDLNSLEKFESWYSLIKTYCLSKNKNLICNEQLFKKLIGSAMLFMAHTDKHFPSIYNNEEKQFLSLL
ncbi:uncharacterized protein LOC136090102 [Hydra vulgaris]|uniref:Uncharacterized protein LOC136090102 n=1 Tax=Hydra vulgaris TaxID=6087 RepID=A0ABM4DD12_HYDVU